MNDQADACEVLVVDDSDELREMLCELFESEGYHPIPCGSGEAAWARLEGGLRPAVMVLDLALPRMSGRELLVRLRATDWGQHIPVLLLTGWDRLERFGDHADAVLRKGVEGVTIMRVIDRLALRGRSAATSAPRPADRRPPHRTEAPQRRRSDPNGPRLRAQAH